MNEGLKVESLLHSYGDKNALDGISFTVAKGAFCALLGPNGAGKSTLFALLTRLFTPSNGRVHIDGIDLFQKPSLALSKIGVVFQQPTLDKDLTVRQNLLYAAALHGLSGKAASRAIEGALERLDMQPRAHETMRALNGGHLRRTEIARALIHQPQVLLLDEPTVGLDAETRRMITDHAHKITSEQGITVLWATHLVDEVLPDDQLVILHQGKILKDGICKDITGKQSLSARFAELTESQVA